MKKIINKVVALLPYLFVFIGSLYSPTDPDLGWHLKNGEYFFKHGKILRDNIFSTMMPHFHWANGQWGTDVITYVVFHLAGFFGLTVLSALVVTGTFYFVARAAAFTVWDEAFLFPLLLYLEQPLNAVSFRGQQLTLLFVALLFWLIRRYVEKQKRERVLWYVIPLFFVWANVHEEFLLGLGLFFLWTVFYVGQKMVEGIKEIGDMRNMRSIVWSERKLFIIFIFSCLVTVINPFGIGVHLDAISHFGNPLLKDVSEYLPFVSLSKPWWNQVVIAMLVFLSMVFLYFNGKIRQKIPFLGVALTVYILSFSVRRYAWPAYYLSVPLLTPLPAFFMPEVKKVRFLTVSIFLIVLVCIAVAIKQPFDSLLSFSWSDYCQSEYILCSPQSAEYLQSHRLNSHLFSLYGWGGWLIWNYPGIKPTIDGRMHLWRENDYSGFADYYGYEQNMKEIDDSSYNVVYMSPTKPLYKHMLFLSEEGKWKMVYKDKYAGIFVRA